MQGNSPNLAILSKAGGYHRGGWLCRTPSACTHGLSGHFHLLYRPAHHLGRDYPMVETYGSDLSTQGLVLSSFFIGYLLPQASSSSKPHRPSENPVTAAGSGHCADGRKGDFPSARFVHAKSGGRPHSRGLSVQVRIAAHRS